MDERPRRFGLMLKRLRLAAGLTHEALAERAGISPRTLSDLERGVSRAPRADTLALLVNGLGLDPGQRALLENAARPEEFQDLPAAPGPTNLPLQLTSFFGRDDEARAIRTLLRRDDIRLITVTGAGGVGKTRLALHLAAQEGAAFPGGIFVVDLAPVADLDGVVQAIGRVLGETANRSLSPEKLIVLIDGKRVLMLLDNFEHLLGEAPLTVQLARRCPGLKIIATSRAALRVSGEQEFPLAPLPTPNVARLPSSSDIAAYPSIALFVDRARRTRPDFALTADNAEPVAAICARLDGLPLALELAAARIKTVPPAVMLQRLQESSETSSLALLARGPRDAPARQQTLQNTIAWSHDLLNGEDQRLFRRLAVFVGGWTPAAAEAICAFPSETEGAQSIDAGTGLASLLDQNLLILGGGLDDQPRFLMLETIREFALEQLRGSGEDSAVRQRHADYYLAIVESTGAMLFARPPARAAYAADHANIQEAFNWLVRRG